MGKTVGIPKAQRAWRGMLMATTATLALMSGPVLAVDGTWIANPPNTSWNSGLNWSSNPSIPDGTATFATSSETTISVSGLHFLDAMIFDNPSDAFTFNLNASARFSFEVDGIVNNGVSTQTFNTNDSSTSIRFFNNSSAGTNTQFNINTGGIYFLNNSSAGSSSITGNDVIQFASTASAGSATIVNNAIGSLLFYDETSAGASDITNNGYMSVQGTATLATASVENASQMNMSEESTAGSASITLLNGSTATFWDEATGGSATVDSQSGSELNFRGTSTAGAAEIGISGEVNFEDDSTAGGATITTRNGGVLNFIANAVAGTAELIFEFGAVGFFTEDSSAGGATVEVRGDGNDYAELTFQDNASAGTAEFEVGGYLYFEDASSAGSASIASTADGSVRFFGDATADNATLVVEGGLGFYDNSTASNSEIENNGLLTFTFLATAGTSTIVNNGTAEFNQSSTGGSAEIENNGNLFFRDTSTAEDATITTTNGGIVDFRHAASGGMAQFIVETGGTFTTETLTAGSLEVGSIAGNGDFTLGLGKELVTGGNDLSTEVSGVISGAGGSLKKVGTGTLTLSGINTLTGGTLVEEGTLLVNGELPDVAVSLAGIFGGTGIINGSINVMNGGAVAPGNSIGTLQAGNVTFAAGTFFDVEVDDQGNSDLLQVDNEATINGGTVRVFAEAGAYAASTQYTILTANDVVGAFDGVTANFAFLSPTLNYDTNNVYLILDLVAAFQDVARTPNQFNTAGAADALGSGNPLYDEILSMNEEEARAAFDALSGEAHASAFSAFFHAASQIREALLARLRSFAGGGGTTVALAQPPAAGDATIPGDGPVVWGQAFGAWGETDGNGNAAQIDRGAAGLLAGVEKSLGGNARAGLALGFSRSDFDVDARASKGESDNFHIAGYASTRLGTFDLSGALAYSYQQADTTRTVTVGGIVNRLTADYDLHTVQAAAEIGTDIARGSLTLTPFAGLAAIHVEADGFTERGGPAALTVAGSDNTTGVATLGLRARRESETVALHGSLAWRHAFGDVEPHARAAFASAPATTFAVAGAPISENALAIGAGADIRIGAQTVLGIGYAGEFGSDSQDHGLKAELTFRF